MRLLLLCFVAIGLPACGNEPAEISTERGDTEREKNPLGGPAPAATVATGTPSAKDTHPTSMKMRATLDIPPLPQGPLSLRALMPSGISIEGAEGALSRVVQDDNVLTYAACPVAEGAPCTVDIRFNESVTVAAIRLFSGQGESKKAFAASGKARHLRIVADGARSEVELENRFDYQQVAISPPVRTTSLRLEVLDVFGKKKKVAAVISELDILGLQGKSRPGLHIDFENLFVTADEDSRRKGKFWIEQIDIHGQRQRLFRGRRVYGSEGRRFLLIDDSSSGSLSDGDAKAASYRLVDTKYRVFYALPEIQTPSAVVTPRTRREGFFLKGRTSNIDAAYALCVDDEFPTFRTFLGDDPELSGKTMAELGFPRSALTSLVAEDETPALPEFCAPMRRKNKDFVQALKQLRIEDRLVRSRNVTECHLPDRRILYLLNDPCSDKVPSAVAVKQQDGTFQTNSFCLHCTVELRAFTDGSIRVAEREEGKSGDIYDLQDDGTLKLLLEDAFFRAVDDSNLRCEK